VSVVLTPLIVDNIQVGDLITVGRRVTLYTVRHDLQRLDGRTFDTPGDAARAVTAMLAKEDTGELVAA
jgi:hypothetical protein